MRERERRKIRVLVKCMYNEKEAIIERKERIDDDQGYLFFSY